jgi:hypothetical protein
MLFAAVTCLDRRICFDTLVTPKVEELLICSLDIGTHKRDLMVKSCSTPNSRGKSELTFRRMRIKVINKLRSQAIKLPDTLKLLHLCNRKFKGVFEE